MVLFKLTVNDCTCKYGGTKPSALIGRMCTLCLVEFDVTHAVDCLRVLGCRERADAMQRRGSTGELSAPEPDPYN